MSADSPLTRCSRCGAEGPRDEMFGLEPDVLCEKCATGIRKRLAPKPVGRLANAFGGKPTPVTAAILGASILVFVLFFFVYRTAEPEDVPRWLLAMLPTTTLDGTWVGPWWELLTSSLVHGGILHILFNSIWIWSLGRAVESTRGSLLFLLVFLASAAFSAAAQVFFARGAGIGLSGVLYALAGYLWMRRREDAVAATVLNPSTARLLGVWFVLCWFLPLGIANWAHAGGLAWGLAAGWVSLQERPGRVAGIAGLAMVTVLAVYWVSTGHHV